MPHFAPSSFSQMCSKSQPLLKGNNCCRGSVIESRVSEVDRSLRTKGMRDSFIEGPGHHTSGTCFGRLQTLASPGPLFQSDTISQAPILRMPQSGCLPPRYGSRGAGGEGRPQKHYREEVRAYNKEEPGWFCVRRGVIPASPVRLVVRKPVPGSFVRAAAKGRGSLSG